MSLLLKHSLGISSVDASSTKEEKQSVIEALMKVVDQAKHDVSGTNNVVTASLPQSNQPVDSFVNEVNSRLPGPISVLFSMIPVNKSRLVRKSGLDLCRVILIDSRHIWKGDNAKSLGRKAVEYCLTLLGDDSEGKQPKSLAA